MSSFKLWRDRRPLKLLTFLFIVIISFFTIFQVSYFKVYLDNTVETKVYNSLNLIETRLFDYVKFLENYYKIPFLPEFAELPESKGWLLDLIDFLQDIFKRERLEALAIFYQKELFLSWNFKETAFPFKRCEDKIRREGNQLFALKISKIEGREYCIFLNLDVSYYQHTFLKYLLLILFFYVFVIVIILYLFHYASKSEERQREIERKLQAERELALLGRMAGTIAHELRNSLNNLFLLLQTGCESGTKSPSYQETLSKEIKRILEWTQDVLLFHKSIQLQPTYFEVEPLLYELRLLAATLQTNKAFTFELDCQVEKLWGDAFWLKKALENLLKNAHQAIELNGVIRLTLKQRKETFYIELFDNGPPIPLELQNQIFEPFFTTKKEGFGLGLYLVKKIIEAHHGQIEIENLATGGKIFRLSWKAL